MIGYTAGLLVSLLFWNVDRGRVIEYLHYDLLESKFKSIRIKDIFYSLLIVMVGLSIVFLETQLESELYINILNFLVILGIIDLSNADYKNIRIKNEEFKSTLYVLTESLVSGFVAPIMCIVLFGNGIAVMYFLLYQMHRLQPYGRLVLAYDIATIIPAIIVKLMLTPILWIKSKEKEFKWDIDWFDGIITNPILNVSSYIATKKNIEFQYYTCRRGEYVGIYSEDGVGKITSKVIKEYLSEVYIVSCVVIVMFTIAKAWS